MFCSDAITTRLMDLSCPMSRDLKLGGWCKVQPPCPNKACLFCALLEACHANYNKDFQCGYLKWPEKKIGSLLNVQWLHWSLHTPIPFDFERLPLDLKYYMLRFMLVSGEPITNPFLQNVAATNGTIKYSWSKFMRPNLIATNKEYYKIGMKMLYTYNTFRFTRLVTKTPEKWANSFMTTIGDSTIRRLDYFLGFRHQSILNPEQGTVNRSTLISKVILNDSDIDSDEYAKRGIANVCATERQIDKQKFQLWQIAHLARWGANLSTLIITIDQEEPGVVDILSYESGRMTQNVDSKEERIKWATKFSDETKISTRKWVIGQPIHMAGLKVETVLVRGTSIFADGKMNFATRPIPENSLVQSDKTDEKRKKSVLLPFTCVPTNKVAKAVVKYFESSMKGGFSKNVPIVSFTSKFDKRRVQREDGTWCSAKDLRACRIIFLETMSKVVRISHALEAYR